MKAGKDPPSPVVAHDHRATPEDVSVDLQTSSWAALRARETLEGDGKIQLKPLLHSLRRGWLLILAFGSLLVPPLTYAAYRFAKPKYEATALVHISRDLPASLSGVSGSDAFLGHKRTIKQLLKSDLLLAFVVKNPEVAALAETQPEEKRIEWLRGKISANFPEEGEVLEVRVKDTSPEPTATLTNAVVQAYLNGNADLARKPLVERLSQLEEMCQTRRRELGQRRAQLVELTEQRSADDLATRGTRQQFDQQQISTLRTELLQQQLAQAQQDRQTVGTATGNGIDQALDPELEKAVQSDPITSRMRQDLERLRFLVAQQSVVAKPEVAARLRQRYQADLQSIQDRYLARLEEHRARQRALREEAAQQRQSRVAMLLQRLEPLDRKLQAQEELAEQLPVSTVELEKLQADVRRLERTLDGLQQQQEKLKLELAGYSRATLLQAATTPTGPVNPTMRASMILAAIAFAFLLPSACVILWGFYAKYIFSSEDVHGVLGLPVIGTVPKIRARSRRRNDQPQSPKHRHRRITESIDNILATIRQRLRQKHNQIIMVASATGEEGKTVLAYQLGVNIAQSGCRAVVVDFDLRRPNLHKVFEVAPQPGVCEVLRCEDDLTDILQETDVEGLWLAAAGHWTEEARIALARGHAAELIEELHSLFQFVLIVGSPVLPVVDSRIIGRLADGIVLSVQRDVSRSPQVANACHVLESAKLPLMGAVVTGVNESAYARK